MTGGSGGVSGTGGSAGSAGTKDGGGKDTASPIPCGETSCNPNGTNRYCNPNGPNGPRCQACLEDSHCANNPQNRTHCDVMAGSCRTCVTNDHCTPPQECIPGTTNNTCQIRCSSDADCAMAPGNRRACNTTTRMCVECQNNTHCAATPTTPVCVGDSCEQCATDADCASQTGKFCNTTSNVCEACLTNAHCAEPTPVCVTQGANRCAECAANADCTGRPGGAACVQNTCRQCSGGANGVPCPAGQVCQMNTCVTPEAGMPEAGGDASSDVSSEGGSDVSPDTAADSAADTAADATGG